MPYRFTGSSTTIYPGYRDLGSDTPLTAVPGGTYDMVPVASLPLPVPPPDGRWAPAEPAAAPPARKSPAAPLPALLTVLAAGDEDNQPA